MRSIVVGAGIVGSCLAYELARAGERVVLAESGAPGGGASAASYAWINSNNFDDPGYHALRVLGMSAYSGLAGALGTDEWLHATGCVRVAASDADGKELRERVARKRAAGYPAELLSAGQAARAEPALARMPREPSAIASFPAEGYIDTTTLIGCLLAEFRARGGVVTRARVTGLRGGGTGVRTTEGDLAADRVIVCTGADTGLLRGAGFDLAARGPAGATVITAPVPVRMRGLVHFPGVTVRPDGGGRLLLHAVDVDGRLGPQDTELDSGAVAELTGRARTWLGLAAGDLEIAETRVSVRPHPPDGFPVVGPVPGVSGAYVVCTHSGVTLAAVLARLVASEIRSGEADPLLEAYRPGRFTG
ncbi:MAG: FAD-binding oxidoreductase [Streptosporangiales bacterium]|nr:FAD-binding oxidoreductase [Streptosporangiales bacterium]